MTHAAIRPMTGNAVVIAWWRLERKARTTKRTIAIAPAMLAQAVVNLTLRTGFVCQADHAPTKARFTRPKTAKVTSASLMPPPGRAALAAMAAIASDVMIARRSEGGGFFTGTIG